MKRGTPNHPKVLRLQDELDAPAYVAAGVLELLWHFTMNYAKAGDIGKWTNAAIARGIGWEPSEADRLIEALINSGWLDESENYRLVVHDWASHCDDATHLSLARNGEIFTDGTDPRISRLSEKDRAKLVKPKGVTKACTQEAHGVPTPCTLPNRSDPIPTDPNPADPIRSEPARATYSDSAKNSAGSHEAPHSGVGLDCATSDERNISHNMTAPESRKRDTGHSRHTHGNNAGKGNLLTGQKRESAQNGGQKREPTAVGAVLPATIPKPGFDPGEFRARTVAEQADEIAALTGEPHWRDWWLAVCGRLFDSDGGWGVLCEHVDHVRNCADPDTRRRKDLGVLDDPAGYLVKRVTAWMKEHRMRWPAFPAKERAS